MRIAVYANCQVGPIHRLIERAAPMLDVVRTPPVHTINQSSIADVKVLLASADVILSQPIGSSFGELSTDLLCSQISYPEWIMFPSMYFGGLFPHLTYLRRETREPLRGPLTDYHDRRIIDSFLSGHDISKCAEVLAHRDVTGCKMHFDASFEESSSREANLPIKIMDYVSKNFSTHRTFHTFNHPTNGVMWHVVTQFLALIGVPMSIDCPPVNQFLNAVSAAIPAEMADAVGLRFVDDEYRLSDKVVPRAVLIEDFYRTYDQTADFPALCRYNSIVSPV